jgi:hypothetical protein
LDSIERFHLLIKAPPFPDLAGRESAGIARYPEDGATGGALVDEADRRLGAVKEKRYAERNTTRRGFLQRKSPVAGE